MRARLVEDINFERNQNPKSSLGLGGISLGKIRFEMKKDFKEQYWNRMEKLLVGKKITANINSLFQITEDGQEFNGEGWKERTIIVKKIYNSPDTDLLDANALMIEDMMNYVYALPIGDEKIYIDDVINEDQNFERGTGEPSDLGLGKWKTAEDSFVRIEEFEENGGILKKDREIYDWGNEKDKKLSGYYLDYDEKQRVHLMYNNRFKSVPIPFMSMVKVPTKIMYV